MSLRGRDAEGESCEKASRRHTWVTIFGEYDISAHLIWLAGRYKYVSHVQEKQKYVRQAAGPKKKDFLYTSSFQDVLEKGKSSTALRQEKKIPKM